MWRVRDREVMSMDNELMLGYDREADVLYLSLPAVPAKLPVAGEFVLTEGQ